MMSMIDTETDGHNVWIRFQGKAIWFNASAGDISLCMDESLAKELQGQLNEVLKEEPVAMPK
jgi:hypothetical protein